MKKTFKSTFESGKKVIGYFLSSNCAEIIEVTAAAGFDFVIIDDEHACWGIAPNIDLVRAADAAGIATLIRVPELTETYVKWALDLGASGVMVPGISSAEEARRAVYLSRFAPEGGRGACPYTRNNAFGVRDTVEYFAKTNAELSVVALIGGVEGVKNYDEILEVEGLDMVFFGPMDLSASLGIPGQVTHPKVEAAIAEMIRKANAHGKKAGMFVADKEQAKKWLAAGADYITYNDLIMFTEVCKDSLEAARSVQ